MSCSSITDRLLQEDKQWNLRAYSETVRALCWQYWYLCEQHTLKISGEELLSKHPLQYIPRANRRLLERGTVDNGLVPLCWCGAFELKNKELHLVWLEDIHVVKETFNFSIPISSSTRALIVRLLMSMMKCLHWRLLRPTVVHLHLSFRWSSTICVHRRISKSTLIQDGSGDRRRYVLGRGLNNSRSSSVEESKSHRSNHSGGLPTLGSVCNEGSRDSQHGGFSIMTAH